MAVTLTTAAQERVRKFVSEKGGGLGLRFGVRKTGCSGWAYVVDLAEAPGEGDQVFDSGGVKVVVDAKSLEFVDGTEIDFARQGLNSTFVFRNPNVTGECGCGESFSVSKSAA